MIQQCVACRGAVHCLPGEAEVLCFACYLRAVKLVDPITATRDEIIAAAKAHSLTSPLDSGPSPAP